MQYLASRLTQITSSASLIVAQAAKALRATGKDVIELCIGEPEFTTPKHIIEAAYQAALAGDIHYTVPEGTMALREAIVKKFKRDNDLDYTTDNIIVANGAIQIIFDALLATLEQNDEVIIPSPYFVSYPEMVKLLGGKPVIVPCLAEDNFRLKAETLEQAITPKTKWLFLNSPNNPSGAVFSKEDYQSLAKVLEKYPHVLVLCDEIYEHIIFDQKQFISFARACENLKQRSLIINGLSKAYAMTGWRVGYAAGPDFLMKAMATVQSQSVTSVCTLAQAAGIAALNGPNDHIAQFRQAFENRKNLMVEGINAIAGLSLWEPEGAFYAYVNCAALIGRKTPDGTVLKDDIMISEYLLYHALVAVVSGAAYGLSPFFRISTAASEDVLLKALARIKQAVEQLKP